MLSPEAKQAVATELKRFAGDLNLSDDQKSKLQTALENAREKIDVQLEKWPGGPSISDRALSIGRALCLCWLLF